MIFITKLNFAKIFLDRRGKLDYGALVTPEVVGLKAAIHNKLRRGR
jgi:hypothetical protein